MATRIFPISVLLAGSMLWCSVLGIGRSSGEEKIKPEELVTKHLESLGPAAAREAARRRVIKGTALVTFRVGGQGQLKGEARLVSDGTASLMSMIFGNQDYPYDKMGFDGKKLTVSQLRPGVRTILGRYVLTNDVFFREGLMGGALSASWSLLDLPMRKGRLQYEGIKKVDNRPLHQVKYAPQKGSDLQITLFFDAETFQHVRTRYHQSLDPNRPSNSASREETRIDITEDFDDFKAEAGLNLPHLYTLRMTVVSSRGSVDFEWKLTLTQFAFDQAIDPKAFNVDAG
jgi:hypothetical protein